MVIKSSIGFIANVCFSYAKFFVPDSLMIIISYIEMQRLGNKVLQVEVQQEHSYIGSESMMKLFSKLNHLVADGTIILLQVLAWGNQPGRFTALKQILSLVKIGMFCGIKT